MLSQTNGRLFNSRLNLAALLLGLFAILMLLGGVLPSAQAATSLAVTKTDDTDDGVCDADCSLREAIDVAVSGDVIGIPAGTYTLTSSSELTIDENLTFNGAGASNTVIEASTVNPVQFPKTPAWQSTV